MSDTKQNIISTFNCVIVGAGAAGLMAAIQASKRGRRVLLLEKNSKPGVKILMSGGTRCNITQNTNTSGIISGFGKQGRFLHSALAAFSNADLIDYFNQRGVPTKIEPSGKVFPKSNRAKDVLNALVTDAQSNNVSINLNEPVDTITSKDHGFQVHTQNAVYQVEHVLITTGGISYPGCGTTGDGYHWCKQFGHSIVETVPALVPLKTPDQSWTRDLQGVTLEDLELSIVDSSNTTLAITRGSTLFTHVGISGPAAMNISKTVSYSKNSELSLKINFLPELNQEQKFDHIQTLLQKQAKKQIGSVLKGLLPSRTINVLLEQAGIIPVTRCAEVSKVNIRKLVQAFHALSTELNGTLGFSRAEVTAGGVNLLEIHSKTMESKCQSGLFLAGEILNLDGPIGGYNFTAAFATGFLAGQYL
ncbi:MAG: aminoacetone oxidase family FAD-binding enzyme [Planctomycetaceae bacterium]|nr:aminoacetone oxidase family FAD-binding enzyme [Planctomycetaceae bacterium]|tara:strand:+ start:2692 stop:3945 length:1254 start_codon:yes stop_codon:yes gene_type:complete